MARNQPGQRTRRIVPRSREEIAEERRFAAWDRIVRGNRGIDFGQAGPEHAEQESARPDRIDR